MTRKAEVFLYDRLGRVSLAAWTPGGLDAQKSCHPILRLVILNRVYVLSIETNG